MTGNEVTDRAELLEREILHLVRAHTDSLSVLDAGSVATMALALAMGDVIRDAWLSTGGPDFSVAALADIIRAEIPFEAATAIIVHPERQR